MTKWDHYFPIYERYFARYVGKPVTLMEVGVLHGGSMQMWKSYFGPQARIIGMDINPRVKALESDGVEIFIGSQSDRKFWHEIKSQVKHVDIFLDDGGHTMRQQKITFDEMYDHVAADGIYICEDAHTSYWYDYGGGLHRRGTFIEFAKRKIDELNAHHSRQLSFRPNAFTQGTTGIHFYDSMVVFEKGAHAAPSEKRLGQPSFDLIPDNQRPLLKKLFRIVDAFFLFLRVPNPFFRR